MNGVLVIACPGQ